MNKYDFHIPFLHSLVVIAAFTLISMAFAHIYINEHFKPVVNTPTFTSQNFQSSSNHTD